MGKPEIARKLAKHLELHTPFTEECQAVYLMMEIRKFLDQLDDREGVFKLLRFYCDWTVHTSKQRNMECIGPIVAEMYDNARQEILNPERVARGGIQDFIRFAALRQGMRRFFASIGLDDSALTGNDNLWLAYTTLIASVLADQPIIQPISEVANLAFRRSHIVVGRLQFTHPIVDA